MLVPDSQIIDGYSQITLQQLNESDNNHYVAFMSYMKVSKTIDECVQLVNDTVNTQEAKLVTICSQHSNLDDCTSIR